MIPSRFSHRKTHFLPSVHVDEPDLVDVLVAGEAPVGVEIDPGDAGGPVAATASAEGFEAGALDGDAVAVCDGIDGAQGVTV